MAIARHELYLEWQRRMGWLALYNSDAHNVKMVGTFCNVIEAEAVLPEGAQALGQLLRCVKVRRFQDETRIRAAINGR